MAACLRIPVKLIALFDIVLTLASIILILAIIRDVYYITPSISPETKSSDKPEPSPELREDDSWMTNERLTFQERSKLMELGQDKWRKRVDFERSDKNGFISDTLVALAFLALWVIFSIFLLATEFLMLIMGIRLFLSTHNKSTHRNDTQRIIKCWIVAAIIFTILSITDFLLRGAHPSHYLFVLEITNIAFRLGAIILVALYFWQVSAQQLPGDSDREQAFYGVAEPGGQKIGQGEYPMQPPLGQFTPGTILQEPGQYPGGQMRYGQPGGWTVPTAPLPEDQPPPYSRY